MLKYLTSVKKRVENIFFTQITSNMGNAKECILMNAFFTLEFIYCPIIWLSHGRSNNNKNGLSERCLQIFYIDKQLNDCNGTRTRNHMVRN